MPLDDSWEWDVLYYSGTKLLGMTPRVFWKSTPRKLNMLVRTHIELNQDGADEHEGKASKTGYIDQVL